METLPLIELASFLPAIPDPLALLTHPKNAHTVIGMAGIFFFLNAMMSAVFFRFETRWKEVGRLMPLSLIGIVAGSISANFIPAPILYWTIVGFLGAYLLKLFKRLPARLHILEHTSLVGALTGTLQGLGVGSAPIRTGSLYAKQYSLAEAWGTTATVGMANFALATVIRLFTEQVAAAHLLPVVFYATLPILMYKIGERYVAYTLRERHVRPVIIGILSLALALALWHALG